MAITLTAAGSEPARDAVNTGRRREAVAAFGYMCSALSGDVDGAAGAASKQPRAER